MGTAKTMTAEGKEALESAQFVLGSARLLKGLAPVISAPTTVMTASCEIAAFIAEHREYENIAVLLSGDVGFYSGARGLLKRLSGEQIHVVSGVSSLQYFCARVSVPWQEVVPVSLHGRDENPILSVCRLPKTFFLTGGEWGVRRICMELSSSGLGECHVLVGENLSYENERLTEGCAQELQNIDFESLAVMLVENPAPRRNVAYSLPDGAFIRADIPMTKSEIRAVALSKLDLAFSDTVYDIGAGTGSVSVELALHIGSFVYAIERDAAALVLIEQNKERFGAHNIRIVAGEAPAALENLPVPDCAFIGGGGQSVPEILKVLLLKNPAVRVVITAITLETLSLAVAAFESLGMQDVDITQLYSARAKKLGHSSLLLAQNPVFILAARGGGER